MSNSGQAAARELKRRALCHISDGPSVAYLADFVCGIAIDSNLFDEVSPASICRDWRSGAADALASTGFKSGDRRQMIGAFGRLLA